MKIFARSIFVVSLMVISIASLATSYYVSWSAGNDLNTGTTLALPFKTVTKAISVAAAGDVIYLRGEVHSYSARVSISKSGAAGNPISLIAYPGDANRAILDFSAMPVNSSNRGLDLSGSYWTFKGFDIYKAGDNGMHVSGSNNTIENCAFYENADTGLQFDNGASNNQVINCDSYYNIDPAEGNADGFAVKLNVGTGNSFRGCRAWQNSDDGWDGLLTSGFGGNPTTTYDSCWAFLNGYKKNMTASVGNGNGFKMGGNQELHDATLRNCLAVYNRVKGFDQNNNKGSMILYNCTGFKNKPNFGMNNYDPAAGKSMIIRNSVSFQGLSADAIRAVAVLSNNSWQSPFITDNSDFRSLDTSVLRAPRNADGSLPAIQLMTLAQGSDLVDGGTNVGLPYYGSAPDLGYSESNYPLPVQLVSFTGFVKNDLVELRWTTATESQNFGWDIEKLQPGTGSWQKIGFVAGKGNSLQENRYTFNDPSPLHAPAGYRLRQSDNDGKYSYSNIITLKPQEAGKSSLSLFPNPATKNITARIQLESAGKAQLRIYDYQGRLIKAFAEEYLQKGTYNMALNTASLSAGNYLICLLVNGQEMIKTALLKCE